MPRGPHEHQNLIADLEPGVPRQASAASESRVASEGFSSLPTRSGDRQPGGREKECGAISQHLLHQVRVTVRAAKQDARSVHFRLDRARSIMHTEISRPGSEHEIHGAFAPGFAAGREWLVTYPVRGDDRAGDDDGRASARPRRRIRQQARRSRTVRFALTDEEYAEVSAAARQAGLARGAYAAEATLAIARGTVTATGRAAGGRGACPGPRRAGSAPDRGELEPGGREAERDWAVVR